jgi:hypothetical protein
MEKVVLDIRCASLRETHGKLYMIRLSLTLAQIYKESGNYEDCARELERLKGKIPKDEEEIYFGALVIKAELLAYQWRFSEAKRILKKVKNLRQQNLHSEDLYSAQIYERIAELERLMGNHDDARKKY